MSHISSLNHNLLTENVIQLLKECSINDTVDFLEKDEDKLVNITNLSYEDINDIRQHIFNVHKVSSISGLELYQKLNKLSPYSTGISRLDNILEGGLPCGKIIELCGLPSSGKTQLALTISCNVSRILKSNVIYIDTKQDFSATRILQILKTCGCLEKELVSCLERIKIIRIWNMNELIQFFHDLRRNEDLRNNVSIIVIDSLPCLMLQHHGEKSKDSIGLLNIFVNIARYIGDTYLISILVINLITRWKELDRDKKDDDENKEVWIQKKIPTLGKYWQSIPFFYIQTENDSSQPSKLFISIKRDFDSQYRDKIQFDIIECGLK